ncbi:hypothetical protein Tsubulata_030807 [Turnera subulata]|uniref:RPN1 N-terminal domain-containing protein n=1 Tax=Turnera subulata TaxID=218843 RepID=A0A9Q0G3V2_9ROSI|nr:hypothetical protein Tsubulata_030807 [Turnera subulata]
MVDDNSSKIVLEALKIGKKDPPEALTREQIDKLFELLFQVQPGDYDKLRSVLQDYDGSPLLRRYEGGVPDRDRYQQESDIKELRVKLQGVTRSIHWKPKLLDFVKPYYEALKACHETMADSDSRKHLADILSVLAPTTSPGESLDYKLLGSTDDVLGSWGPGYVFCDCEGDCEGNCKDACWSDSEDDCGSKCKSQCGRDCQSDCGRKEQTSAALALRRSNAIHRQLKKLERFDGDRIEIDGVCAFPTYGPDFSFNPAIHGSMKEYDCFNELAMKLARDVCEYNNCIEDVYRQLVFKRLVKAIVYPQQHFFITLEATVMGHLNLVQAEVRYGCFYVKDYGVEFIIHKIQSFYQVTEREREREDEGPAYQFTEKETFQ